MIYDRSCIAFQNIVTVHDLWEATWVVLCVVHVVEHCNVTNEQKDKQTFGQDLQDEEVLTCIHRRSTFNSRFNECVHFYAWVHECIGTVM